MLSTFKRWLSRKPSGGAAGTVIQAWAQQQGYTFHRMREPAGAVVDCTLGRQPWRLEWSPSQRPYIGGTELRMTAELGLERDLHALVLNRPLMEVLEKSVFDEFVQGVQTRIDTETPQEVRWLVMLPRLSGAELRELRERYGALCSVKPWAQHWLAGPLGAALNTVATVVPAVQPMVITLGKGRLTLRTSAERLDAQQMDLWQHLFEAALREAIRAATEMRDVPQLREQSTMPAAWPRTSFSDTDLPPPR